MPPHSARVQAKKCKTVRWGAAKLLGSCWRIAGIDTILFILSALDVRVRALRGQVAAGFQTRINIRAVAQRRPRRAFVSVNLTTGPIRSGQSQFRTLGCKHRSTMHAGRGRCSNKSSLRLRKCWCRIAGSMAGPDSAHAQTASARQERTSSASPPSPWKRGKTP